MRARRPLGVIVAALLAFQACDDAPVSPEADLSLDALGRDGGTVTVPMEVDATFMWIVDTEEFLARCDGTPGLAEGFGSGEATHLGRFDITELDHCSVDIAAFQAAVANLPPTHPDVQEAFVQHFLREGEFEWRAADGGTLSGSYVLFTIPAGPATPEFAEGAFFTMTVTDGTGRFAGATGELEADLERSTFPFSDDPLFLGKATFPVVLEGELTLPRPGRGR